MGFNLSKRPNVKIGINLADYCFTAERLGVHVSSVRAVDAVESAGSGFLARTKRPKILFEGHYFYKFLKRKNLHTTAAREIPTIAYRKWTKRHYFGREKEYQRLAAATEFCHRHGVSDGLALVSASWGRFQVMGANYRVCGYRTVEEFVEDMFEDEANHLNAFIEYLENTDLVDDLQRADADHRNVDAWRGLARGYNGKGYVRNRYHIKMRNAAVRFRRLNVDCADYVADAADPAAPETVMPSGHVANAGEDGFQNTSLDDRFTGGEKDSSADPSASSISSTSANSLSEDTQPLVDQNQTSSAEDVSRAENTEAGDAVPEEESRLPSFAQVNEKATQIGDAGEQLGRVPGFSKISWGSVIHQLWKQILIVLSMGLLWIKENPIIAGIIGIVIVALAVTSVWSWVESKRRQHERKKIDKNGVH